MAVVSSGQTTTGLWCLLLFLIFLCLPGCGGCRKSPEAEEQEKQQAEEKARLKEREKEPFESRPPAAMPPGGTLAGRCKPGHWMSQIWPEVKANRGDFQGELQTEVVTMGDRKVPLGAVPYQVTNQRPAALAKDQPKSLESFLWVPPQKSSLLVNFRLAAAGGPSVLERSMGLSLMPSYRYFFVVLSQAAGRYEYLDKKLASMRLPLQDTELGDEPKKCYEVVSMPARAPLNNGRRPSLPSSSLYWTSIAYLLWDDFDPALWDVDQQRAVIDWLHWGGQIIVSGPDALERLHNSFLQPYLPAAVGPSRNLIADDLRPLGYWSGESGPPPTPVRPWSGAVLKIDNPHAHFLPHTGNMVVERPIGRGRIVASAFRLTGPELTGWKGFDCFFNACLLRRPARVYPQNNASPDNWSQWVDGSSLPQDAATMTALRYFVRDAGVGSGVYGADTLEETASDPSERKFAPGLGAWNDFGPVAQAARAALKDAAGIKVPERSFVIWVVAGYLCVLVPVNWIVFRLLGRVEWAWVAAPLIAVACTAVVIQRAQLNIGFARSQNEIAVIEMQAGYARAHVARYNVFYTALATRYEFRLEDPFGQILPFPRVSSPEPLQPRAFESMGELVCRRGDDTRLTGFSLQSNSQDRLHSEEMTDFGGTVNLYHGSDGTLRVTNATKHALEGCRAIRGEEAGEAALAEIGPLGPGATAVLKFKPYYRRKTTEVTNASQGADPSGQLDAEAIAKVALDLLDLRSGEVCFLARVTDKVPGLTVTPAAEQVRQAALLVAHLDPGQLRAPERDKIIPNPASQGPRPKARGSNPGYSEVPTIELDDPSSKSESPKDE